MEAGAGFTVGQHTQKCYISRKQNVRQKKAVECGELFITGVVYGPQELYGHLAQELSALAERHGERLLHTPHNPISLGEKSYIMYSAMSYEQEFNNSSVNKVFMSKINVNKNVSKNSFCLSPKRSGLGWLA